MRASGLLGRDILLKALHPRHESPAHQLRSSHAHKRSLSRTEPSPLPYTHHEDTTVRDVATSKYDLFWRTVKRNGSVVPLTERVLPGDIVAVEDEPVNES